MIVSDSITVGQITFILRVAIQILAYGGVALLVMILLGNAPRVGMTDTHSTINRIIGASTQTRETARWILGRLRGRQTDPSPSTPLLLVLSLYLSYAVFVSLSDIGFLGFYACSVPGSSFLTTPASVNSTNDAKTLVSFNMINDTNPGTVGVHRCNSVQTVQFDTDVVLNNCTSWENGTYADRSLFDGLNSTDSDVLMPRFLTHHTYDGQATFDLNSYYIGPNTQRTTSTTIQNGVVVDPTETGVTTVFGVPNLTPDTEVNLAKTLAVELEVGCMTVGIYGQHDLSASGNGIDVFRTSGTWRKYTGPDYMMDILANYTDQIRDYMQPLFNATPPGASGLLTKKDTNIILSTAANVRYWRIPTSNFSDSGPQTDILGNCTAALENKLGITSHYKGLKVGGMCNLLGVGGSINVNGTAATGFSRMICATATQVNMVAAKIGMNSNGSISVGVSRLPSDLHYLQADYWDARPRGNQTVFNTFDPIERFTLSDNPNGPTSHFIPHQSPFIQSQNNLGPGSPGNAISLLGHSILGINGAFESKMEYAGLSLLPQGYQAVNFTTSLVTEWIGQIGASFVLASIGYNGWAALESRPIEVVSTGGHAGTCYKPLYAIGFLPLVLAACVIIAWSFLLMLKSSLFGSKGLQEGYDGLNPYMDAVYAGDPPKDAVLAWESSPKPHLRVVSKGAPIMGDSDGTALRFLKSGQAYSP